MKKEKSFIIYSYITNLEIVLHGTNLQSMKNKSKYFNIR